MREKLGFKQFENAEGKLIKRGRPLYNVKYLIETFRLINVESDVKSHAIL